MLVMQWRMYEASEERDGIEKQALE